MPIGQAPTPHGPLHGPGAIPARFATLRNMRVAVFSTKPYDRTSLTAAAQDSGHELEFFEARLCCDHAPLAAGFPAVCAFVHDELDEKLLRELAKGGTRLVALRAAGFNNVDLAVARRSGSASRACQPTHPTPWPSTPWRSS